MPEARANGGPGGVVLVTGYGHGDRALASALEERGIRVHTIERFSDARTEAQRLHPDAILVGSQPEAGDRGQFIRDVAADGTTRCLLYMAPRADISDALEALATGVHDVVAPPHSAGSILLRMAVLRSRASAGRGPGRSLSWGRLTLDLTSRQVLEGDRPLTLSGREFELLLHLLEARGRVVSRDELLGAIWGSDQGGSAVLDATVHRLRRKLAEVVPNPDLVETVRGVGYRLEVPPPRGDRRRTDLAAEAAAALRGRVESLQAHG
jgi:two-component system response regulator ResD